MAPFNTLLSDSIKPPSLSQKTKCKLAHTISFSPQVTFENALNLEKRKKRKGRKVNQERGVLQADCISALIGPIPLWMG